MNHPLHPLDNPAAFKMTGSIYTLTTLELQTTSLELITAQLQEICRKAPHFFDHTPVILSFDDIQRSDQSFDLQQFRHLCYQQKMILIATRGGGQRMRQESLRLGIAWLPSANRQNSESKTSNVISMNHSSGSPSTTRPTATSENNSSTMFIDQPVRSGQQIYAPGDLVISSAVSSGAELLAGGSIHVYGPLRGRALAGINGDKKARIFCRQFEAELISIGGQYKVPSTTNTPENIWGKSIQVQLDAESLHIHTL